jgi:hypothetical protein
VSVRTRFFDGPDYSFDAVAEVFRRTVTDGYAGGDTALLVSAAATPARTVRIALGALWVQGRMLEIYSTQETRELPAAVSNPRICRIVGRINTTAGTGEFAVKAGAEAQDPQPPPLQRDTGIWELSLAQWRVNTNGAIVLVKDERNDRAVCGRSGPLPHAATHEDSGADIVIPQKHAARHNPRDGVDSLRNLYPRTETRHVLLKDETNRQGHYTLPAKTIQLPYPATCRVDAVAFSMYQQADGIDGNGSLASIAAVIGGNEGYFYDARVNGAGSRPVSLAAHHERIYTTPIDRFSVSLRYYQDRNNAGTYLRNKVVCAVTYPHIGDEGLKVL